MSVDEMKAASPEKLDKTPDADPFSAREHGDAHGHQGRQRIHFEPLEDEYKLRLPLRRRYEMVPPRT